MEGIKTKGKGWRKGGEERRMNGKNKTTIRKYEEGRKVAEGKERK